MLKELYLVKILALDLSSPLVLIFIEVFLVLFMIVFVAVLIKSKKKAKKRREEQEAMQNVNDYNTCDVEEEIIASKKEKPVKVKKEKPVKVKKEKPIKEKIEKNIYTDSNTIYEDRDTYNPVVEEQTITSFVQEEPKEDVKSFVSPIDAENLESICECCSCDNEYKPEYTNIEKIEPNGKYFNTYCSDCDDKQESIIDKIENNEVHENKVEPANVQYTKPLEVHSNDEQTARYELYKDNNDGMYHYRLRTGNDEILLVSNGFTTYDNTLESLKLLRKYVVKNNIKIESTDGFYSFIVYGDNVNEGHLYESPKYIAQNNLSDALSKFIKNANTKNAVNITVQVNVVEQKNNQNFENFAPIIYIKNVDGNYSWELTTSNNELICSVASLASRTDVDSSIQTVKQNLSNGKFHILKFDNKFYFKMNLTTNNVITSKLFNTQEEASLTLSKLQEYFLDAKIVEL